MAEFFTLAQIKFIPTAEKFWQSQSLPCNTINELEARICRVYVELRVIGYHELADKILNLLMDDIGDAIGLVNLCHDLITEPMDSPLFLTYKPILSKSRQDLLSDSSIMEKYGLQATTPTIPQVATIIMPYEIGELLMSKLTYLPEGYDACLALMDKYRQADLNKLLGAVQQGCVQNNADIVSTKGKELALVFDNLWKDSKKVKSLAQGIHYGVMAEVGVVGALATAPLAGIGGILASLGFEVADRVFGLSEGTAEFISPSYTIVINDFKKKYSIS